MNKVVRGICTLAGIGYLPAGGTVASLVTAFVCAMHAYSFMLQPRTVLVLFVGSRLVIAEYLKSSSDKDPSEIVLDELVGMMAAYMLLPYNLVHWVLIFVLFRFFDIVKPWPISLMEKAPGALGVLLDDLVAGLFARIILLVCIHYGLC